jgi:hypothetical protein
MMVPLLMIAVLVYATKRGGTDHFREMRFATNVFLVS